MPRRKDKYPEKPWRPDPTRWRGFMEKGSVKQGIPLQPKGGWQLWDWRTLENRSQDIRGSNTS